MADPRLQVVLEVVDKASAGLNSAMGKFGDLAKKLQPLGPLALGAGAAMAGFAAISIKSASDLSESTNKAAVTFRELGTAEKLVKESTSALTDVENDLKEKAGAVSELFEKRQKAMENVDNANKKVRDSQLALQTVQLAYNKAMESGKKSGDEMALLSGRLEAAQNKYNDALSEAGDAQTELNNSSEMFTNINASYTAGQEKIATLQGTINDNMAQATEEQQKAATTTQKLNEEIDKFSKTSAGAFGISKQAALEYTSTLGNIFQASGLGSTATADMSVQMVKLAADMASFNNIPIDEALEKIRSGLVGEVEPLRTVGVLLSETAVAEKALQMGLAATKEELTQSDKVQARYALILEQTKLQQGDFARTSEGMANQMRIAKAQFADASATLGGVLLPIMTKLLSIITPIIASISEWANAHPRLTQVIVIAGTVIGVLLAALGGLLIILPGLVAGFTVLTAVVLPAVAAFLIAAAPILAIVAAVALLAAGVYLLYKNWDTVWNAIKDIAADVWGFISDLFNSKWGWILPGGLYFKAISFAVDHWSEAWNTILGIATTIWDAILSTGEAVWGALVTAWQTTVDGIKAVWEVLVTIAETVWNVLKTIIEIATYPMLIAIGLAWLAFQELVVPIWNTLLEIATAVFGAIRDFIVPIFETIRDTTIEIWNTIKSFQIDEIWNPLKDTVIEIWTAVKDFLIDEIWNPLKETVTTVFNDIKTAIETATNTVRDTITNVWNEIKDFIENRVLNPIKNTFTTIWEGIRNVVQTAILGIQGFIFAVLNPIKGVIEAVWNPLLGVFERIWNGIRNVVGGAVDFIIGKMNALIGAASNVIDKVGGALGKVVDFASKLHELGADVLGKIGLQHGGLVKKGGLAIVGEAGPELVALPSGSRVYSNKESRGMAASFGGNGHGNGGSGQLVLQFNAPIYGMLDFRDEVMSAVRAAMNGGGLSDLIAPTAERVFR